MPLVLDVLHAVAGRRTHKRHASTDNLLRWMHVIPVVARVGERQRDLLHNKLQNYRYFPSGDARRVPATCAHIRHTTWRTHPKKIDWRTKRPRRIHKMRIMWQWIGMSSMQTMCLDAFGSRHLAHCCRMRASEWSQQWNTLTCTHIRPRAANFRSSFENQNCPTVDDHLPFAATGPRRNALLLYRIHRNTDIMQHISSSDATDAVSQ